MAPPSLICLRRVWLRVRSPAALSPAARQFSAQWKQRRDSDMYADMAIRDGLRSRAAFKLSEIDDRFGRFLRQGAIVIDLGAAPGGFASVAAKRIHVDNAGVHWEGRPRDSHRVAPREIARGLAGFQKRRRNGKLVCVDLQEMEPIQGAQFVKGDFTEKHTRDAVLHALNGQEADIVMSDMSPPTTGDKGLNHDRIMILAEEAATFARSILRNGGIFVCKIFNGSGEANFRTDLRCDFLNVRAVKPLASRKTSPEIYYVANGYVPHHLRTIDEGDSIGLAAVDELMDALEARKSRRLKRK